MQYLKTYLKTLGWDFRKTVYQKVRGTLSGVPAFVELDSDLSGKMWRIEVGSKGANLIHEGRRSFQDVNEVIGELLQEALQEKAKLLDVMSPNPDLRWWRKKMREKRVSEEALSDRELKTIIRDVQRDLRSMDPESLRAARRGYERDIFSRNPEEEARAFVGLMIRGELMNQRKSTLKKQLIKMGSTNPELREHLRPLLATLEGKRASHSADINIPVRGMPFNYEGQNLWEQILAGLGAEASFSAWTPYLRGVPQITVERNYLIVENLHLRDDLEPEGFVEDFLEDLALDVKRLTGAVLQIHSADIYIR